MFKILINYAYEHYPFTTASYLEIAARARKDITVFRRGDELPPDLDLVLNIEPVGEFVKIPGVPTAYYEIDNHVIFGNEKHFYDQCDVLFLAQWYFKDLYAGYNIQDLPLAADPALHRPFPEIEEKYDIGIIGNTTYPKRKDLLNKLSHSYNVLITNSPPGIEYSKKLSECKMLFNCAMNNDINMRTFESVAIQKLLFTDRIPHLEQFLTHKEHCIMYDDWDDLNEQVYYYLNRSCYRATIAKQGRDHIVNNHTYAHRLNDIIKACLPLKK